MPNIKFSYLYRDGANYKNFNSLIFDNPNNITLSELESLIRSKLIDNTWFYVSEWQLPDLHFRNYDDSVDHGWHEFESIEYSDEQLNPLFNLAEFILKVKQTNTSALVYNECLTLLGICNARRRCNREPILSTRCKRAQVY